MKVAMDDAAAIDAAIAKLFSNAASLSDAEVRRAIASASLAEAVIVVRDYAGLLVSTRAWLEGGDDEEA